MGLNPIYLNICGPYFLIGIQMVGYELDFGSKGSSSDTGRIMDRLNEISQRLQHLENRVDRLERK
mgnify:CR=1 FL=1